MGQKYNTTNREKERAAMAVDIIEFEKGRFMGELGKAVERLKELPLRGHLEGVAEVLKGRSIGPRTPMAMKEMLYKLQQLLAECVMWAEAEQKRKSSRIHLKKLRFLRRAGKKLLQLKKELQSVKDDDDDDDDDSAFSNFSLSDATNVCLLSNCWWWGKMTYGLEDKLQCIKARLSDDADAVKAIAIVGMCGVGKTTLARNFLLDCRKADPDITMIWARLSEETTPSQILTQLLQALGKDNDPSQLPLPSDGDACLTQPQQLRKLHDLLHDQKYIIVLDNVCHLDEWYSDLGSNIIAPPMGMSSQPQPQRLSQGLPRGSGGVVLVTTPFQDVGRGMVGEQNLIKLEPTYSADQVWSMFMGFINRKRLLSQDHQQTISRMKDEIIYRCGGLPLAAQTLAEVISIHLAKEEHWSSPSVSKRVWLRIDSLEMLICPNILEKIKTYPGVEEATAAQISGTQIVGCFDVMQLMRDFGKSCEVVLINVDQVISSFSLSDPASCVCLLGSSRWWPSREWLHDLLNEYESKTYGLEDKVQSIKARLFDADADAVKAIAIVGMCGVGKTRLARAFLLDCMKAHPNYYSIIWVRLSEETTPSQILTHLLQALDKPKDPLQMPMPSDGDVCLSQPQQLRKLHDLLYDQKYIIVLDNVCHLDEWYSHMGSDITPLPVGMSTPPQPQRLSQGLPRGSGGIVLVTSPFQDVGRSMAGDQNLIKLEPTYSADQVWSMFIDSINRKRFLNEDHHQTLSRMYDEIVHRCGGLPLAAKTLAEVISTQLVKQEYWSRSIVRKIARLRIDMLETTTYPNILEKMSTYPGVDCATFDDLAHPSIAIVGGCFDVMQLLREFGKSCEVELIDVVQAA